MRVKQVAVKLQIIDDEMMAAGNSSYSHAIFQ